MRVESFAQPELPLAAVPIERPSVDSCTPVRSDLKRPSGPFSKEPFVLPDVQDRFWEKNEAWKNRLSESGNSDQALAEYLLRVTYALRGKEGAGIYAGKGIADATPFERTYTANHLNQVLDNAGFMLIRRMVAQELGFAPKEVEGLSYKHRRNKFILRNGGFVRLNDGEEKSRISQTLSAYVPATDPVKESLISGMRLRAGMDFDSPRAALDRHILSLALTVPKPGNQEAVLSKEYLGKIMNKAATQGVSSFEDTLTLAAYEAYKRLHDLKRVAGKIDGLLSDKGFVASLNEPVPPVSYTPWDVSEEGRAHAEARRLAEAQRKEENARLLARAIAHEKELEAMREYSLPILLGKAAIQTVLATRDFLKGSSEDKKESPARLPSIFAPESLGPYIHPPIRDPEVGKWTFA